MTHVDNRNVSQGKTMWSGAYCDQPYVVSLTDGRWLSVLTVSDGHEGDTSQRIVSMVSADQGATWSDPQPIEDNDGREASWAMPLVAGDRIFVFYTFNTENIRSVPTAEGPSSRVDTLGSMMLRYSDDAGRTWSERIPVPIRTFAIDRGNDFKGAVHYWWAVGKPLVVDDTVYLSGSKVGRFESVQRGFQADTEGFVLRSDDLLSSADPTKATWTTLPHGDSGIRVPNGQISEEHKLVSMGAERFTVVFRTSTGGIGQAATLDRGGTWTEPQLARYTSGVALKNPRAAAFAWEYATDRYLLWFHNNANGGYGPFRNPVWLASGRTWGSRIVWSEPEVVLYDQDPLRSMSYPDLIIDPTGLFLTETDKQTARVHAVSPRLVEALERQWDDPPGTDILGAIATRTKDGNWSGPMPQPEFWRATDVWRLEESGEGFSVALSLKDEALDSNSVILSTLKPNGQGWSVTSAPDRRLRVTLCDGRLESSWTTDPIPNGAARIVLMVDGAARLFLCVVNGRLQDGQEARGQGWGRIPRDLHHAKGAPLPTAQTGARSMSASWHVYERAVYVSEAVLWTRVTKELAP